MTTIKNNNNLIERKQYLQMFVYELLEKGITNKQIQYSEYHSITNKFSPNLSKMETLANLLKEDTIKNKYKF